MRSVATAVECYFVDYNQYPSTLTPSLTTPIAYITGIPFDPFSPDGKTYQYAVKGADWKLWSVGPSQTDGLAALAYDPTNGSVSDGDIIRVKQ